MSFLSMRNWTNLARWALSYSSRESRALKSLKWFSMALNFSMVPHVHWLMVSFSLMNSLITSEGRGRFAFFSSCSNWAAPSSLADSERCILLKASFTWSLVGIVSRVSNFLKILCSSASYWLRTVLISAADCIALLVQPFFTRCFCSSHLDASMRNPVEKLIRVLLNVRRMDIGIFSSTTMPFFFRFSSQKMMLRLIIIEYQC